MPTSCECTSCQWIKNPSSVVGGILPVGKSAKWMVNHNQSSEAILSWLALQPVEHQSTLDRLGDDILDDLGSALGSVQRAMRMVWTEQFSDDPLVRIHTVSFMESEFDDPQQPYHFHIHFFLIPRSKYLGKLIRRRKPGAPDSEKQCLAWEDYKIFNRIKNKNADSLIEQDIPWDKLQRYIRSEEEGETSWKDKREKFMSQLRNFL